METVIQIKLIFSSLCKIQLSEKNIRGDIGLFLNKVGRIFVPRIDDSSYYLIISSKGLDILNDHIYRKFNKNPDLKVLV